MLGNKQQIPLGVGSWGGGALSSGVILGILKNRADSPILGGCLLQTTDLLPDLLLLIIQRPPQESSCNIQHSLH